MLIPFNWLKEFVDLDSTVDEIARKLTVAGTQVSGVTYSSTALENVVVGEILKIKPHPNADNLLVCQVSDGRQIFSVVCGAKNVKARDRVPFARLGATLPGGIRIAKKKIREEVSSGMLCSAKELGLGEDHEGILILPKTAKLGENVDQILLSNPVLNVELTANRSDCASVFGIAREVAAILGGKAKKPETGFTETQEQAQSVCGVSINDPGRCSRYIARVVKSVKVENSPDWLVRKIEEAGLRPVNNVVDITNYVLMELGHPLHAFDYDKLAEHRIVVRCGTGGEKLRFLDGVERELKADDLLIADAAKPVALAGVMGGEETGVTAATKNILLESAYFNGDGIRKTAKQHNLNTEASYRFERGVDIENVLFAMNRAVHLIQKICGGEVPAGMVDVYPSPVAKTEVLLSVSEVKRVLGQELQADEIKNLLALLGFECADGEAGVIKVAVPSHRNDVKASIDLVEEVARMYGYDRIPAVLPAIKIVESEESKAREVELKTRETLQKLGFYETINFALVSEEDLGFSGAAEAVKLKNPLVAEQSVLRTCLLPGLLLDVKRNSSYKVKDIMIFEIGRVFSAGKEGGLPVETNYAAGCITGARREPGWEEPVPAEASFHWLKGMLEALLGELGVKAYGFAGSKNPMFNSAASADLTVEGAVIGVFGEISRAASKKHDFIAEVLGFKLDLDGLVNAADFKPKYRSINRFPAMKRDISFLAPNELTYSAIYDKIKLGGEALIKNIQLFDMYSGKQVQEGYRGMAIRITYQSEHRTLIDQEVNDLHARIVSELEKDFRVIVRK